MSRQHKLGNVNYNIWNWIRYHRFYPGIGVSAMGIRLHSYDGIHVKWPDKTPGPYDSFRGIPIPGLFEWSAVISSGPDMFLDFLSDGSRTSMGMGFTVSVSLRPKSM